MKFTRLVLAFVLFMLTSVVHAQVPEGNGPPAPAMVDYVNIANTSAISLDATTGEYVISIEATCVTTVINRKVKVNVYDENLSDWFPARVFTPPNAFNAPDTTVFTIPTIGVRTVYFSYRIPQYSAWGLMISGNGYGGWCQALLYDNIENQLSEDFDWVYPAVSP